MKTFYKILSFIVEFLIVTHLSFSQNPEWINYLYSSTITSIATEGSNIWIGTYKGGLLRLDPSTGEKVFFNRSNSDIPNNSIALVAVDKKGYKWIGTYDGGGLVKYDDTTWTIYNNRNSGIPDNMIRSMAIDSCNNIWIGTEYFGLVKFDGYQWTVYGTWNSDIPDNDVTSIAIDDSGNKWIGTYGSLSKFND
jgi:ligand-binding sensor domain-containing protein